jgi:hypothetical protein
MKSFLEVKKDKHNVYILKLLVLNILYEQVGGSRSTSEETPLSEWQLTVPRGTVRDGWLQNRNDIQSRSYEDAANAEVPGAE